METCLKKKPGEGLLRRARKNGYWIWARQLPRLDTSLADSCRGSMHTQSCLVYGPVLLAGRWQRAPQEPNRREVAHLLTMPHELRTNV